MTSRRVHAVLSLLVGACSCAAIVSFTVIAIARLRYPYELDWLESGLVEHVRRAGAGHSLYVAPSVDFIPFPYPPVFPWVTRIVSAFAGYGFFSGRLVSLLATFGTFAVLYMIVVRATRSKTGGLVASGLYAASYSLVGGWFDVGKSDSLFLCFTVLAVYALFDARDSWKRIAIAACVTSLAILTKQTAIVVALPLAGYLLMRRPRFGALFVAIVVAIVGGLTLVLSTTTNGWFDYWVWDQLREHGGRGVPATDYLTVDLRPYLLVLGLAATSARYVKRGSWNTGVIATALSGMLIGAWLSRLHDGAFTNVLMPACAALALCAGLLFAVALQQATWRATLAFALVIGTFAMLAYSPGDHLPHQQRQSAGKQLIAFLRNAPGDVLVMSHPTYAVMAGKPSHGHFGGAIDIDRAHNARAINRLHESYIAAIRAQRFSAVLIDGSPEPWLADAIEHCYSFSFVPEPALHPIEGFATSPTTLWTQNPNGCN